MGEEGRMGWRGYRYLTSRVGEELLKNDLTFARINFPVIVKNLQFFLLILRVSGDQAQKVKQNALMKQVDRTMNELASSITQGKIKVRRKLDLKRQEVGGGAGNLPFFPMRGRGGWKSLPFFAKEERF